MPKESILIVEDEYIVAMDIRGYLERNEYAVVGHIDRGEEAVKKAGALHPDLILMDISIKGDMDGIEAAIQIREKYNLPVIFLTAFANQPVIDRALLAQPYGYLLKPFEERELIISIEMALYKHRMERKLQESEGKFRGVIEQATDGIALFDSTGNIIEWNSALEQITGVKRSDAIGQPIWQITFQLTPKTENDSTTLETHAEMWQTAIKMDFVNKDNLTERIIETDQGNQRTTQSSGFILETSQGTMAGVIIRDITKIKLLEETERDQRQLAEALLDTATALNSTLRLDEILDRILDNVGKLTTFDSAMVVQIEGSSVERIRYRNNRQTPLTQPVLGNIQANLINVPILNTIVSTKRPLFIDDIQKDSRWNIVNSTDMQRIRSLICVPITIREKVVGLINVISSKPGFFRPFQTERIMAFANQAGIALENARLYEEAKHLSLIDPLTEMYNMRYFHEFAKREFERTIRYNRLLSIAMIDIDHFKIVNDTYGHSVGDLALREISRRIHNSIRKIDIVARYGGEEFILLMPETSSEQAVHIAERIRLSVANNPIEKENLAFFVSLSLGVAELGRNIKKLNEIIESADKALYSAKAAGRNRVVVFEHINDL